MRAVMLFVLALGACDDVPPPGAVTRSHDAGVVPSAQVTAPPTNVASNAAATAQSPVGPPDAQAPASAVATTPVPKAPPMPERPVPKTSPTVAATMPPEVQMKAIAYMAAMRAPHPDDPPANESYANELKTRLVPINSSLDKSRGKLTSVDVTFGGREIALLLGKGCDDKYPVRAVVQRAGTPLSTLRAQGVLVVRCNDARLQCLQSTRDPSDILCTTSIRH